MNAKPTRRVHAVHATRPRGARRLAHAAACGAIAASLIGMPVAQAFAQGVPGLPAGPVTLAANAPIPTTMSAPRAAAASLPARGPNCIGPLADHQSVSIPVGKSTMVELPEAVKTRTVGNPMILQAMLVSARTLYLVGSDVGTTNMIVQGTSGACMIIDVSVGADPQGLKKLIMTLMPGETGVQVHAAADALVLSGTVSDSVKAARILELAQAFVARPPVPVAAGVPVANVPGIPAAQASVGVSPLPINGGSRSTSTSVSVASSAPRVIDMMQIAAPQQVMLEVKVAEVSKTLIDQLGAQANLNGGIGSWSFGLLASFLSGGAGLVGASKANNSPLGLTIDAQKSDQLVKILAEPNLMAISGQEASFLAGGKVYIPVPQSTGAGGTTITLQEETYGVGLKFTPTVLEGGRINLKVAPEVSELSQTGITISANNGTSAQTVLPLITTRRASTTLQVFDGQSFVIGGLLKNNVTGTIKGLPGAGELPVLGALFRSTSYQQDKTELVFVVTPRLAKPLPEHYPLPTDHFGDASEGTVIATGNMEGRPRKLPENVDGAAVQPQMQQPAPVPTQPAAGNAQPAAVTRPVPTVVGENTVSTIQPISQPVTR